MTDTSREAFEGIFTKHFPVKSRHRKAGEEIWQAAIAWYQAELEKRLQRLKIHPIDEGCKIHNDAIAECVAIVRGGE